MIVCNCRVAPFQQGGGEARDHVAQALFIVSATLRRVKPALNRLALRRPLERATLRDGRVSRQTTAIEQWDGAGAMEQWWRRSDSSSKLE